MIKNFHFLVSIFLILLLTTCSEEQSKKEDQTPNIIFILTDDLGYGDLGLLYQNQRKAEGKPFHKTPYLDKVAGEGTLLTRHYAPAPVCAPSRASLLTGMHQGNATIRNNQFDKALPDNHTIASVLKEAGYRTAIIGKYGLQGKEGDSPEAWEAYPTKRGFDYFFGYVRHRDGHNHYPAHQTAARPPVELYDGTEEISAQLKGCYTTDLFTARAKKWIEAQSKTERKQPFFLYLAYDTPHAGLEVASSPYPEGGGLNGGLQLTGEPGKYINTVTDTINSYFHPDYADQDWPETQKRFASMVRRIDNGVGDLIQLLKDLDIDDNTLIVFSSDNGPHRESYGYGDYDPTFFDSYGPLDGIKRDTWEGGIRVPTFVRWPGTVQAGQRSDHVGSFSDWLATFADAAGLPAPANSDGTSLLPVLTGDNITKAGEMYVEYFENRQTPEYERFHPTHQGAKRGEMQVVYLEGYKGVRYNIQSHDDDFMIFDTNSDPQETNNLAGQGEAFSTLQQKMKDRVLQLRRSNPSALRPYDSIPVPALEGQPDQVGRFSYKIHNSDLAYLPDVNSIKREPSRTGVTDALSISEIGVSEHEVVEFTGYIKILETGLYTFKCGDTHSAVLRIHDILVIDNDRSGTRSHALLLEEGIHPITLTAGRFQGDNKDIDIEWSGP